MSLCPPPDTGAGPLAGQLLGVLCWARLFPPDALGLSGLCFSSVGFGIRFPPGVRIFRSSSLGPGIRFFPWIRIFRYFPWGLGPGWGKSGEITPSSIRALFDKYSGVFASPHRYTCCTVDTSSPPTFASIFRMHISVNCLLDRSARRTAVGAFLKLLTGAFNFSNSLLDIRQIFAPVSQMAFVDVVVVPRATHGLLCPATL